MFLFSSLVEQLAEYSRFGFGEITVSQVAGIGDNPDINERESMRFLNLP